MMKIFKEMKSFAIKHNMAILILSTIFFEFIIYLSQFYSNNLEYVILGLYLVGTFLLLYKKNNHKQNIFNFIFLLGVLIRTLYIMRTNINTRQHDVNGISDVGHLGYIYTLFKTHQLPRTIFGEFYHPPLWHLLSSFWLELNNILGVQIDMSLEGIQLLTLYLSSFMMIMTNIICLKLKLKDKYRLITILFVAIHPTLIILSGSISNDLLMTFLELFIINFLINWYDNPSIKNTIILAITTGLCVMTKTNGAIMAIPILYIFIKKFIEIYRDKTIKIADYIKKIALFGIISLPIGLWFHIWCLIKYHDYQLVLDLGSNMYTGNHSVFSRFFTINFHELFNFSQVKSDYNLPSYLIKTSIFGEFSFENIGYLRVLLIALNLVLVTISLIMMIRYILKNRKNTLMNILTITFITSMISMYIFYYLYPNTCSMDFRYIVITLIPGIIFITYSLDKIKSGIIKNGIKVLLYLFFASSLIFEFMIQ